MLLQNPAPLESGQECQHVDADRLFQVYRDCKPFALHFFPLMPNGMHLVLIDGLLEATHTAEPDSQHPVQLAAAVS